MNWGIVVDEASWCRCVRRAASACKEAEAARKQMGQEWGKVCLSLTRRFQQVLWQRNCVLRRADRLQPHPDSAMQPMPWAELRELQGRELLRGQEQPPRRG